ncbi:Major facilitator superfamily domain general substrate transporter [Penicillium robsamsonii]|uniref:Major facilitator superfamily domain general substrate transporter n=1 Tax=Penicillium robsamsonii TaxID=1792511 RepID=UPI002547A73E|nr:Major facilitator superfamily domain general substrate transporter [Penicillium robsamsonii]KAJ5826751.1 Major facilitator superfamily domain general substrate transporter [Penicillium robsamsonii]
MFGIPRYFGWRGRSLNLAISSLGSLDFLLFGYDQGITGGLLDLPSFTKYFPEINPLDPSIQDEMHRSIKSQRALNQGIAVASYNLGCFIGAVATIFIGNPLGRRRTIFCGCVIMTTGALLQCTAYSLPHFIIGRIVTGVGNGMNTSTVPTWQSESAKAHDRGKMVMIEGMLITGGITLSYWINYGMSFIGEKEVAWRFPLAFQIVFAVIIFCSILNLPESPRWLVMQGRNEEALDILECLNEKSRDDPYIKNELLSIQETVTEMNKGSYKSLFKMSEYREFHRVALAYVNQMFQQISGINLITYYAPQLYAQIGLAKGNLPKLLAACNGTEYLMAAFIPIYIIEKVGRRPLMLFGAAGMSISMAILAGTNYRLVYLKDSQAGIGQAVFLFVFNTFFAIGWLGMTWLYPAEIVPLRIRAPTNALATSANWIFNFMVVMITPVAFDSIGYKTYIIFAVINAFMFPCVYFFFPETRYRSLEEMDAIFKKSTNVFDAVTLSIKTPYRYDKHGELKPEYLEDAVRRTSVHNANTKFDSDESEVKG